ncbi:MAG: sarcosine oxidase subunit gamma [Nocardioidaceae bacterium]
MSNYTGPAPVARSPIAPVGAVRVEDGWEVGDHRATAALTLADASVTAKLTVRATPSGSMAEALGTRFGRTVRDGDRLIVGSGPGEWLVVAPVGDAPKLTAWLSEQGAADPEPVSVVDVSHGRALMRLTGPRAADLLAKLCAVDLSDAIVPDGGAFRSSVAKLITDVVRDDAGGMRSYLLHCERSSGQYLWGCVLDAGAEYEIEAVDVFP